MTNLQELKNYITNGENIGGLFYIKVEMDGFDTDEILINSYENLHSKLKYYTDTYNEDLTHKHANIKIVDYGVIPSGTSAHNELLDLIED
ncbi:hypothetical protein [Psychrobacillus phage Perkons]|nr:hypothetical protein [Psychrobacillus phage Perkons]